MTSFKNISVGSNNSIYLKLVDGANRIRLVSEPIEVWTSFNQAEKTAKKYLNEELARNDSDAKKRCAMWVIDRADGKIKLAEFGAKIMNQIQVLANDEDYGFETVPSYDLKITRSGSGLETDYSVMQAPPSVLTADEQAQVLALESVYNWMKKQPNVISEVVTENIPF